MRIGIGYDVHRLTPQRKLVLGGVEIPSELGLEGHSDADVLVHALMDALLGAAGMPDIGVHFPNSDPQYKNASSILLLGKVNNLILAQGFAIANVDITLVAEKPRVSASVPQMKENISRALQVPIGAIGIKATTNEGIGFIGRGEGIAAIAVALLKGPSGD